MTLGRGRVNLTASTSIRHVSDGGLVHPGPLDGRGREAKMQYVCYTYNIPKNVTPSEYPNPTLALRAFGIRAQQSVWILPEVMLPLVEDLSIQIRRVNGSVDIFELDERAEEKIRAKARKYLEAEAERIRAYLEASIRTTSKRLRDAQARMSVNDVNSAIRYQQTAIHRAKKDLTDAERCAVAFDLSGEVDELIRSVRSLIDARAAEFSAEKASARASVLRPDNDAEVDPASLGFGNTESQ